MKKRALVSLTLIIPLFTGIAQLVVNDPQANANLMQQIAQGAKTVEQTAKSVKLLKEAKQMYDDVNGAIQTLEYISDMSVTTKKIIENSGSSLKQIQKSDMFSPKEMNVISQRYSSLIAKGNIILKVANDLLSGGIFKMNDAERMVLLRDSKQELQETLAESRSTRNHYMRVAEKRALQKYFIEKK
ncbi:hypothetical protein FVB32_05310 [Flagellimonas hymeniacidonis]|uniref:Conjugal transfer protein n=1 Tax=Flagellimonas hymeniacidonis TaxID=2603628 RepID=A0A5C8V7Q4_9FLAO|nr:hypothetical protein [Flagellimonas hymeniacidonis]TXN37707.1 hypothetical protein FVB32_05310 [Flagellimonas hymeniacidonis]